MPEKETRGMSHHILTASSTLMGISFAIVTLIGAFGHADKTLVDDFALLSLFLFFAACLFSCAWRERRMGCSSSPSFRSRCCPLPCTSA